MKSPARELLDLGPYSVPQDEKARLLLPRLEALTRHHHAHCAPYRHIVDRVFGGLDAIDFTRLEGVPFLPVALFKALDLRSAREPEIIKVLTSSGTTGSRVSRVALDAETAQVQAAVLVRVAQQFLGRERLPMIVIDHAGLVRDRVSFSARGAGVLGMMQFGWRPFHALREDMTLDLEGLLAYVEEMRGRRILLFGFTWMVWRYFAEALCERGVRLNLGDAILVHSGGWKKLQEAAVTPDTFRDRLREVAGIPAVLNFYGMVEQVGSVYFENELHMLQCPLFSDVVVRDPVTLEPVPDGTPGLLQVTSVLPTSYPGHSLLTEDLGVIRGADLPGTALKGRAFEVLGRIPRAELRGCSDTFEAGAA
jgi:phenylacetate-coenzyme A ligase PaaK-like adenylate-forming protein